MKKVIVLGMSSLILWGCNKASENQSTPQQTETQATQHHDDNDQGIELNNGEKWIVNEEMKPFVVNGADLVGVYIQEGKFDYEELAGQLKEQNNQIIKSCTMKGKSHDELHKWLHPHLELVKELENETDAVKANQIVAQLQDSYRQYHRYFN